MATLLQRLWDLPADAPLRALAPATLDDVRQGRERLRAFVDAVRPKRRGRVERGALVRGEIVASGRGSVIEAGAVVHSSCRLVLGEGSVVRSGAVLRDEVVVGPGCQVGVHGEVVRSAILGPGSISGHFVFLADSVLGRDVVLSGYAATANTSMGRRGTVGLRIRGRRIETGRTHLGLLAGDGARLGAGVLACPGTIVLPGVSVPPHAVLLGTVDAARAEALIASFYERWGD